jgi:hypothetical protein
MEKYIFAPGCALFSLRLNLPFWASAVFSFLALIIIIGEKKKNRLAEAMVSSEALAMAEQKIEFAG